MAFQTSTTTSGSPSQTGPGNANPNLFSPVMVMSPPLILAFLAIGIFSTAMIAIFFWKRRVHTTRNFAATRTAIGPELQKPRLYDLWTESTVCSDVRWENIMPLATMSVTEVIPTPASKLPPPNPVSLYTTPLRYIYKLCKTARHSDEKNTQTTPSPISGDTHLQVAVAIALPSPRHVKRSPVSEDYDNTLEYSIGLHSIHLEQEEKV